MIIAAAGGFLAGVIHSLSGPDHLAAVMPLSLEKRRGWLVGLKWGLGHGLGVFLLYGLVVLLRLTVNMEVISSWSERLVGIFLIGLGIWGLQKAIRGQLHLHEHDHEGETRHQHVHLHTPCKKKAHLHGHAALAVGTLHGLAGMRHLLIGILPALAFASWFSSIGYVAGYGIGNAAGMVFVAWSVGAIAHRFKAHRLIFGLSSTFALAVGLFWLFPLS